MSMPRWLVAVALALGTLGCAPADRCGDSVLAPAEDCDDGNLTDGDGCSASCRVEAGFVCDGHTCTATRCGDGFRDDGEACDDGNLRSGDGCTSACAVEHGFECSGTPSDCLVRCGDGQLGPGEGCDDGNTQSGDGCGRDCALETGWTCRGEPSRCESVCGDGLVRGQETCDDGNLVDFDGCSHRCRPDTFDEVEPNDDVAHGNGPFSSDMLIRGAVTPAWDTDTFLLELSGTSDVSLETFDESGPDRCLTIDTTLEVLAPDGSSLASDDDSGLARCSRLDLSRLPAGRYAVQVRSWRAFRVLEAYRLVVRFTAVCGDGVREGSEQCDSSPGCSHTCQRVLRCGDGFRDGLEACDDGNVRDGDGCDMHCQLEAQPEAEPNDTVATATPTLPPNVLMSGTLGAGDVDTFALLLPTAMDLRVESFDGLGPGSCVGLDTVVRLLGTDGGVLVERDQGGLNNCGAIDSRKPSDAAAQRLGPGTVYVQVQGFRAGAAGAYQVRVSANARCGNGVVEGSEQCEGGPRCTAQCQRVPTCGDGLVDAPETCDDGNTLSGDGCSGACQLTTTAETEPNDTPAQAGATTPFFLGAGALVPAGDVDVYAVALASTSDLIIETFDGRGPGHCEGLITEVSLLSSSGAVLARAQGGGFQGCARLDAKVNLPARHLAPGTYFVAVREPTGLREVQAYTVRVRRLSTCGDGVVEGFESCDGTANCSARCELAPVCGDGFVDAPETCDDGNVAAGDGCDAACATEAAEVEPNDTTTQAATLAVGASVYGGLPAGDVDLYRVDLTVPTVVHVETLDASPSGCAIATHLEVLDASGVRLWADDASGVGACSSLVVELPVGTSYLSVAPVGMSIAEYVLSVKQAGAVVAEVEPNELRSAPTPAAGSSVLLTGSHQLTTDVDVFRFWVPAGRSVRAELVEGGAERCEGNSVDGFLSLADARGLELGWDDDSGRGACARVDGTSALAPQSWASRLPAGDYFLTVQASPFSQTPADARGQFDYRVVLEVR